MFLNKACLAICSIYIQVVFAILNPNLNPLESNVRSFWLVVSFFCFFLVTERVYPEEEPAVPVKDRLYYMKLPDPFHINLEEGHIMRVRVSLSSYNKDLIDDIKFKKKLYIPLRHHLHKYFSKHAKYEQARTSLGKQQLAEGALVVVRDYLKVPEDQKGIEEVFFEEIMVQ